MISSASSSMPELNLGQPFYELGRDYRASANLLLARLHEPDAPTVGRLPVQFLYSHAVELLLKAYLRLDGITVHKLERKPFAHDLVSLYATCRRRGLALAPADEPALRDLVERLTEGHADYQYRYFDRSFTTADPMWMKRDVAALEAAVGVAVAARRQAYEAESSAKGQVILKLPSKVLVSINRD